MSMVSTIRRTMRFPDSDFALVLRCNKTVNNLTVPQKLTGLICSPESGLDSFTLLPWLLEAENAARNLFQDSRDLTYIGLEIVKAFYVGSNRDFNNTTVVQHQAPTLTGDQHSQSISRAEDAEKTT